jgi:hypothetical protein
MRASARCSRAAAGAAGQSAAIASGQFAALRKEAGSPRSPSLSGANGVLQPTREERDWLAGLKAEGSIDTIRAVPNMLSEFRRAAFPSMVALARCRCRGALYRRRRRRGFEPAGIAAPEAILVNSWGVLAGRRHGTGAARNVTGKEVFDGFEGQGFPRSPVVAITGMGVVSSLGVGIDENWAALVAGAPASSASPAPTEHLRTTIAGTIDFITDDRGDLKLAIGEIATDEAIRMARIGAPGDFPGPLFTAIPPVELGWTARRRLYDSGDPAIANAYDRMSAVAEGLNDRSQFERVMYGYVAEKLADRFGTKGAPVSLTTACASGATAIQLGVEAIRRGETRAALCVGTDCSVTAEEVVRFSLLSALSNSNAIPEEAAKPFSKNRDGFVIAEARRRWCSRTTTRRWRAAPRCSRSSAAQPTRTTTSTVPARSPMARRSSARCARPSTTPACMPTRSSTSTPTAPARRRTTRWRPSRSRRSSASGSAACRSVPTSR